MPDSPREGSVENLDSWNGAPCGLLRIDPHGLVLSANVEFLDRVGYGEADVVGRLHWDELMSVGSRVFYQTQLAPVLELDGSLREVMLDLRDAAGMRIPVLINASRSSTSTGRPAGAHIAVMSVPDRRAYETELRSARDQAERAQAADTQARFRLELIARANAALASSMETGVALQSLARVLVAELADWCVVYADDPDPAMDIPHWSAAHTDPARQPALEQLAELLPQHVVAHSGFNRVLGGTEPVLLECVSDEYLSATTDSEDVRALYEQVGLRSLVIVPTSARGARVATIIVARSSTRTAFSNEDLADLADLGMRAGIVIDNLRRLAREHNNSIALQQALLTAAPSTPRVQIETRYLPATSGNEVGGDWYDAFLQADGTPVVVIGDVVGHDIHAAAAMGQLRGVIRTLGYARASTPAGILSETDATAEGLGVKVLASTFVGRVETDTPAAVFRWSNAGHPPPLLLDAAGVVRALDNQPDPMLGVIPAWERSDWVVELSTGDVLLLYTDGLIERVDEDIDVGLARLTEKLATTRGLPLDQLCDAILSEHRSGRRDDIALLALKWLG